MGTYSRPCFGVSRGAKLNFDEEERHHDLREVENDWSLTLFSNILEGVKMDIRKFTADGVRLIKAYLVSFLHIFEKGKIKHQRP